MAGKPCTVGLTEAFDKTLLNIARILDKRRILSSYFFMFQTWQNVTVIQGYIIECDLRRAAKFFSLWQQVVSGQHFESNQARHLATQV